MSGLPEPISKSILMFMVWCGSQDIQAEVRAAGITTLNFGQDRLVTMTPMWNNFSGFYDNPQSNYDYLKLWVPVNNLVATNLTDPFLDNLPFSIGQYPNSDGEAPGSRWPIKKGELGLTFVQPLDLSKPDIGLDFESLARSASYLITCAQLFEEQLNGN